MGPISQLHEDSLDSKVLILIIKMYVKLAPFCIYYFRMILWTDWYFHFQYVGSPVAYLQQIVIKATVEPWDYKSLIHTDAFRAPLDKTFDILEQIQNFQIKEGLGIHNLQWFL